MDERNNLTILSRFVRINEIMKVRVNTNRRPLWSPNMTSERHGVYFCLGNPLRSMCDDPNCPIITLVTGRFRPALSVDIFEGSRVSDRHSGNNDA